jgi:hypothetical protein
MASAVGMHSLARLAAQSVKSSSAMHHVSTRTASHVLRATTSIPATTMTMRHSSHSPLGHPPTNARQKVTLMTLASMYKKGEPITMLTAHDFPSAHVADHGGMDMVLVGDSLAMVSMGLQDTSEVTLEEMLMHCRSVNRAVSSAFTVSTISASTFLTNNPGWRSPNGKL